jgi:hypothetical protein
MDAQANRERGSDLFEIHDKLQQNGKELEGIVSRFLSIGEKLEAVESKKNPKIEPDLQPLVKRPPGRITDLYMDADGWRQLNQTLGTVCSKMERILL